MTGDLIARYLAELGASLRTAPERTAEIVAEAEDHLRESAAAGLAIGMPEREAQEAAISAFGPVRAVVRAHHRRPRQLAADLVMAGLKLGWTGMFAIAASGFVALAMDVLVGRSFVGGTTAPDARFTPAQCRYWLSLWHGARTCGQAHMLESSSDAVTARVFLGGIAGAVLLACYLLAKLYWRRGDAALPGFLFPLTATAIFTTGALALVVCTFTGGPFGGPAGPGTFLSGAIVAAAVAAASAVRAHRALRPARLGEKVPFLRLLAGQRHFHAAEPRAKHAPVPQCYGLDHRQAQGPGQAVSPLARARPRETPGVRARCGIVR